MLGSWVQVPPVSLVSRAGVAQGSSMTDHPPAAGRETGQETRPTLATLQIVVGNIPVETFDLHAPVELGRREPNEPAPYFRQPQPSGPARIVIADWHEKNVSRKHLLIEPLPD